MTYDAEQKRAYYQAKRKPINDRLRDTADHDHEPWLGWEEELLLETVHEADSAEGGLTDAAELLGRTLEACRYRLHLLRTGSGTARSDRAARVSSETPAPTCSACGLNHPGEC